MFFFCFIVNIKFKREGTPQCSGGKWMVIYIIPVYVIRHYAKELQLRRLEPKLKYAPPKACMYFWWLPFSTTKLSFLHHQIVLVVIGMMIIPGVWMQRGCGECYGGGEGLGPASAWGPARGRGRGSPWPPWPHSCSCSCRHSELRTSSPAVTLWVRLKMF